MCVFKILFYKAVFIILSPHILSKKYNINGFLLNSFFLKIIKL